MKSKNSPCKCPYCKSSVHYEDAESFFLSKSFPYDNIEEYKGKKVKICDSPKCDSYVIECSQANGVVANRHTRLLRKRTHQFVDILWRTAMVSRKETYMLLAKALKCDVSVAHISGYDVIDCVNAMIFVCCYINDNFEKIKTFKNISDEQKTIIDFILRSKPTYYFDTSDFSANLLRKTLSLFFDDEYKKVWSVNLKHGQSCSFINDKMLVTMDITEGNTLSDKIRTVEKKLYNEYAEFNSYPLLK